MPETSCLQKPYLKTIQIKKSKNIWEIDNFIVNFAK